MNSVPTHEVQSSGTGPGTARLNKERTATLGPIDAPIQRVVFSRSGLKVATITPDSLDVVDIGGRGKATRITASRDTRFLDIIAEGGSFDVLGVTSDGAASGVWVGKLEGTRIRKRYTPSITGEEVPMIGCFGADYRQFFVESATMLWSNDPKLRRLARVVDRLQSGRGERYGFYEHNLRSWDWVTRSLTGAGISGKYTPVINDDGQLTWFPPDFKSETCWVENPQSHLVVGVGAFGSIIPIVNPAEQKSAYLTVGLAMQQEVATSASSPVSAVGLYFGDIFGYETRSNTIVIFDPMRLNTIATLNTSPNLVQSFAIDDQGQTLAYVCHRTLHVVALPSRVEPHNRWSNP
jgi:hypothetical protein